VDDVLVYDRSFDHIGNLPSKLFAVTAIANDGSRAFVYAEDAADGGPRLEIYDLNGALQPGALFPLRSTQLLPDAAGATSMTVSPDDSTVFIIGETKLLIVPD
jgi:hypothetical protein